MTETVMETIPATWYINLPNKVSPDTLLASIPTEPSIHCSICAINPGPLPSRETCFQNIIAAEFSILDPNLCLREAAADFYLLMEMVLEGNGGIKGLFYAHAERIADQLCAYIEMASLGELRHHIKDIDREEVAISGKVGNRRRKGRNKETREVISSFILLSPSKASSKDHRMSSWKSWSRLYDEFGLRLYGNLIHMFSNAVWGSGFGGYKWARCLSLAENYRMGLDNVVFVDSAFGLKHNGSLAYDKFWSVRDLQQVLDYARKGQTDNIEHYASPGVRSLRHRWREKIGARC